MRRCLQRVGLVLSAALALAGPAAAQARGGTVSPVERAEMERRIREGFERLVRQQLGMTDESARELSDAVLRFQGERVALLRREALLRQRFQGQGPTGRRAGGFLPDDEAREVLREMRAIQNAESELFNREHERLLQLLSPGQLVSYYLLREQLADALRRARGGAASP